MSAHAVKPPGLVWSSASHLWTLQSRQARYLLEDSRPPQGSKTSSRPQDLLKAPRPPQGSKASSKFQDLLQQAIVNSFKISSGFGARVVPSAWATVAIQLLDGLVTAAVIKYSNNMKVFGATWVYNRPEGGEPLLAIVIIPGQDKQSVLGASPMWARAGAVCLSLVGLGLGGTTNSSTARRPFPARPPTLGPYPAAISQCQREEGEWAPDTESAVMGTICAFTRLRTPMTSIKPAAADDGNEQMRGEGRGECVQRRGEANVRRGGEMKERCAGTRFKHPPTVEWMRVQLVPGARCRLRGPAFGGDAPTHSDVHVRVVCVCIESPRARGDGAECGTASYSAAMCAGKRELREVCADFLRGHVLCPIPSHPLHLVSSLPSLFPSKSVPSTSMKNSSQLGKENKVAYLQFKSKQFNFTNIACIRLNSTSAHHGVDNYKIYETIDPLQRDVDNIVDAASTAAAEASIPEDDEAGEIVDSVERTLDMIWNAFVSGRIIFWCEIICEKDNELNECQLSDQLAATLEWLHCGAIRNSPGIQLKSAGDQPPPTCVYLITST
ncbi:hypothetical protein C8F04DRAFT_1191611 [Mycena alexandri]|uniref:Uncharacterized protein n=1 Tax=Mycena alexandri TaxID=1745969 RepID=A0AAD6SCY2_9AGAR|nr:hypothetical protein C8F04DRAFT_1191611 [Mycena alexandri]